MHREDFQIFENYKKENKDESGQGCDLIYFDNASTSQMPNQVLDVMNNYYTHHKSNIDRGLYKIEEISSQKYEKAREKVAKFLNIEKDEVIFTSSATDSSNKLVLMIEKYMSQNRDIHKTKNEILILNTTHSSEFLPIQEYAKRNNLTIKIINNKNEATENNIENKSEYHNSKTIEDVFLENISEKTLIVSMQLVSNITGKIFDNSMLKKISRKCKDVNVFSILDISAGVGHMYVDLKDLDFDTAYFSAHKMCGPAGVGVLYIKRVYSRDMQPVYVGGGMVSHIEKLESTYRSDVKVFEAGTQNIPGVIGTASAVEYIENVGVENILMHNQNLLKYFFQKLEDSKLKNNQFIKDYIKIYSEKNIEKNIGIISFEVKSQSKDFDIHAHDIAQILADSNICVRSGHHCAQLFIKDQKVLALTRLSFYFYNTEKDIDLFFTAFEKAVNRFIK